MLFYFICQFRTHIDEIRIIWIWFLYLKDIWCLRNESSTTCLSIVFPQKYDRVYINFIPKYDRLIFEECITLIYKKLNNKKNFTYAAVNRAVKKQFSRLWRQVNARKNEVLRVNFHCFIQFLFIIVIKLWKNTIVFFESSFLYAIRGTVEPENTGILKISDNPQNSRIHVVLG